MSDSTAPAPMPAAQVRPRRRIPLVWIVPLLTALIAAWLVWDTYSKRGPTIVITFETASGLTAGQSQLKYKDVVMGTVRHIAVAHDLSHVNVTVETVRQAESLLSDKTIFWVVKPQLFAGNITGLDTILSGSYIGMRPGETEGKPQRKFVGQEDPPLLRAWTKGTTFKLTSKRLGSIGLGAPIFFRDIEVGAVLGWDLGDLANSVTIHAFVRAPYDQYVHEDSSFWNASGLSIKLGGEGVSIQLESVRALLLGGIAFDTPRQSRSAPAKPDHGFPLYGSADLAKAAGYGLQVQLLSYFPGSVAGLEVGSPVTFHGLKVGEVTDVSLVFDKATDRIVVPVHYRVEAGRVANLASERGVNAQALAEEMIRRGLRATLQSTSLLTGQKSITLDRVADAPPAELKKEGDVYVIPTSEVGGFDSLTRSATELLDKINRIDFDRIGKDLAGAMAGLDQTINGPQIKRTLTALEQAMVDVQDIARKLDTEGTPALKRLPAIANQLQDSLTRASRLFASFTTGYGDESRFLRDIDRMLPQITDAARSIRTLADLLSRHPDALLKGRPTSGKE